MTEVIPQILAEAIASQYLDLRLHVPELSSIDVTPWIADDFPRMHEAAFPVILLRDCNQVDEQVMDAHTSARTFEQTLAVAAHDIDDVLTGAVLVRAVVSVLRTILLDSWRVPNRRILEVSPVQYGYTASDGSVDTYAFAVAEMSARIWSIEPTIIASGHEPVITSTEVTVTPVDANGG